MLQLKPGLQRAPVSLRWAPYPFWDLDGFDLYLKTDKLDYLQSPSFPKNFPHFFSIK